MTQQTNDILPEGYKTPSSGGNYMKLETGDNEFRALSKPILGWIYWDNNSKPVRVKSAPETRPFVDPSLIKADKQGKKDLKFFWSLVVYNYKTKSIQILEFTQSSIQKGIEEFLKSPKWGSYYGYDINIKKIIVADKTSYQILTNPPAPVSEEIKKAYTDKGKINLEALFGGGDPFSPIAPVANPVVEGKEIQPLPF